MSLKKKTVVDPEMQALAHSLAKKIKTQIDLNDFSKLLKKMTVEAALGGEMEHHLGYGKHAAESRHSGNSRNGYSRKTLKGDHGEVMLEVPRDRNGEFEPQIVGKHQTRLTQMDDQILSLYVFLLVRLCISGLSARFPVKGKRGDS